MSTINLTQFRQVFELIRGCCCNNNDCRNLNCNFMLAIMLTENPQLDSTALNPNRDRDEIISYDAGLMQINTKTAIDAHCVTLRQNDEDTHQTYHHRVAEALYDIETNIRCACRILKEAVNALGCPATDLIAAAYNAGWPAVKNARWQQKLNDLANKGVFTSDVIPLTTDGIAGPLTRKATTAFCNWYKEHRNSEISCQISGNGIPQKIKEAIEEEWERGFPERSNPVGEIPNNSTTPDYVNKFRRNLTNVEALEIPCCPTEGREPTELTDEKLQEMLNSLREIGRNSR